MISLFVALLTHWTQAQSLVFLDSPSSVSDLFETIDLLTDELHAEVTSHERVRQIQSEHCEEETQYRHTDLAQAQATLAQVQTSLDRCQSQQTQFTGQHTRATSSAAALAQALQLSADQQAAETQANSDLESLHRDLLHILEGLMQLTHEDAKVRDLTDALVTQAQMHYDKSQEMQLDALKAFDSLTIALAKHSQEVQTLADTLRDSLTTANTCVDAESAAFAAAQTSHTHNLNLKETATALCNDWERQYQSQKARRDTQLSLLQELQALAEAGYGHFEATSRDRADKYKEEWDNFQNAYVFKSQVGYQHEQVTFDN